MNRLTSCDSAVPKDPESREKIEIKKLHIVFYKANPNKSMPGNWKEQVNEFRITEQLRKLAQQIEDKPDEFLILVGDLSKDDNFFQGLGERCFCIHGDENVNDETFRQIPGMLDILEFKLSADVECQAYGQDLEAAMEILNSLHRGLQLKNKIRIIVGSTNFPDITDEKAARIIEIFREHFERTLEMCNPEAK